MKIAEMGLVAEAQLELKDKADKYVAKSKIDPSTYNCKMMSDVAYSEDGIHNLYSIGQRSTLSTRPISRTEGSQGLSDLNSILTCLMIPLYILSGKPLPIPVLGSWRRSLRALL